MVASSPLQDEIWLVSLDPTKGSEMRKTRPCLMISPDEMNRHLRTLLIAPMTTAERPYPTRLIFGSRVANISSVRFSAEDSWRCQNCGTAGNLQVHHIQSRRKLGTDSLENLITLCAGCHEALHRNPGISR